MRTENCDENKQFIEYNPQSEEMERDNCIASSDKSEGSSEDLSHSNTLTCRKQENEIPKSENHKTIYDEEKQSQSDRKLSGNTKCILGISIVFCFISVAALLLVVFRLFGAKTYCLRTDGKEHTGYSMKTQHYTETPTASPTVSGKFKLDVHYLKQYQTIRWELDENSSITPQEDGGCLVVPTGGKYLAVSKFTFWNPEGVKASGIFHTFTLLNKKGDLKAGGFKRQYVSAVEKQKATSVFIELFELEQGEQICVKVTRVEFLYPSRLDNDVTIIKI